MSETDWFILCILVHGSPPHPVTNYKPRSWNRKSPQWQAMVKYNDAVRKWIVKEYCTCVSPTTFNGDLISWWRHIHTEGYSDGVPFNTWRRVRWSINE